MSANKKRNTERLEAFGRNLPENIKEFVTEKRYVLLPAVLAAAFLLTVCIGLFANRQKEEIQETQADIAEEAVLGEAAKEGIAVPDVPLEENAYPEVNELIMKYYRAMESGETDSLSEIVSPLTDSYRIRFAELSKHVEACPAVNIYTKPGPVEDSYIAYVCTEIQMVGYGEKTVPGIMSFYICKNDAGNYYINIEEEIDQEIADYITAIDLQDDVVDLNNRVTAAFNNLVAEDKEAADNYVKITQSITKGVQEAMQAENGEAAKQETQDASETATAIPTGKTVKAIDVVNMRSSDSEIADKLGKVQIGDTFSVLEERANGWTKVTDGTQEFFLKSEYLETVTEATSVTMQENPAQAGASDTEETENTQETASKEAGASLGGDGYVKAKEAVNIRKSPSETAEKLGLLYKDERLEFIESLADGWCKVKYNGQTAYVKSEFVE